MKSYRKKIQTLFTLKKYGIKKLLIVFFAFSGVVLFILFLFNFPFFRQGFHRNDGLRRTINNRQNLRIAYFRISQKQDSKTILDKPIQSSGCNTNLSLTLGTATNMCIQSGKKQRMYLLYIPPHYSNTVPHALILSFHGYASNDQIQERMTHFNILANRNNFVVVYPQGTTGLLSARGWNTGIHPTITVNDVLFVSNMLNQLQSNLCINPKQIYATGFSNGGGFVGKLACVLSNRIAAFAPISGSYVTASSSCATSRAVPIMEFHGTADKIVPYDGIPLLKEFSTQLWLSGWAKNDGCSDKPAVTKESTKVTRYEWTNCHDNASIIHYKILGEHHIWPNTTFGESKGGKKYYGTATEVIWNFFQQHPLEQAIRST